jgi:hypothetical protein
LVTKRVRKRREGKGGRMNPKKEEDRLGKGGVFPKRMYFEEFLMVDCARERER